jgi:hypothetical protein
LNYLNNSIIGIADFFISIIHRKFPILIPKEKHKKPTQTLYEYYVSIG